LVSNVVLRSDDIAEDLGIIAGIARRNAQLGGPEVHVGPDDRLVLAGLFIPNAKVDEESIKRAEDILERDETLYAEGYGSPDLTQLPEKYERWGFRCVVARKCDMATVFFHGTPVMQVYGENGPTPWCWIYDPDHETTESTAWNEAVQNAADCLENYGEYPCTEEEREGQQGYGICELAETIGSTWLR
jgi:hypothetical protein